MLFAGDSANLEEQVTQARAESGLSKSTASLSEASTNDENQPLKQSRASQQTAELIRKARKQQRKQAILEAYLQQKILIRDTSEVNASRVRQKLDKLCAQLPAEDSEAVFEHGQHYLQHIQSICQQKLKRSSYAPGSAAARVAHEAEQQHDPNEGIGIVLAHMQAALHDHQGPHAKRGAMQQAFDEVTAALAFPQHPTWQAECNDFMEKQTRKSIARTPGFCCKRTALKLNTCSLQSVREIANTYFCDKIVTHWNIGANQGHMEDKLQAMLPLLKEDGVKQRVSAAAEFSKSNMELLRSSKKASEGRRSHIKRHLAAAASGQ